MASSPPPGLALAVQKIQDGTATITGRVTNDMEIDCISLDDHEHSTVHHVEMHGSHKDFDSDEKTLDVLYREKSVKNGNR